MYNKYDIQNSHPEWQNNIQRWQFLIDSYFGGKNYRDGKYLLNYVMESQDDYEGRLENTPLDNHVKAVVAIYNSFLFRKPPKRDFGTLKYDPSLEQFLEDADLEGRSFDSIMRDISSYSSVYGHVWCIIDKPQTTAYTRAEELGQGIRPYISIYTPENVIDWQYTRGPNGAYRLTYLKVLEGRDRERELYRIYKPNVIELVQLMSGDTTAYLIETVPNALGQVPAVCVYTQRSPVRGIGVSDCADVADMQRSIYNELSEGEQLLRLTNHPSLVKTPSTQAAAGAGSIIQMPDDLQPELKPYLLQPNGASIDGLLNSMKHKIEAIDRMAHMGGIRSIETRRLSGVALATEFQLLSARLAEKASQLELAEEQIWRLYCLWQGLAWDGTIDYPDSFNIQDRYNDMNLLKQAKDASPKSEVVNEEIERQMLRILVDDDNRYYEMVDHVKEKTERDESAEKLDSLQVYEKAKQVLSMPTTGNSLVDQALNNEIIDETVDDPMMKEQLGIVHMEEEMDDPVYNIEGRTYPDGEPIPKQLPPLYQSADGPDVPEGQNCENCGYLQEQNGEYICTKFVAPVRPVFWCAKWEPKGE